MHKYSIPNMKELILKRYNFDLAVLSGRQGAYVSCPHLMTSSFRIGLSCPSWQWHRSGYSWLPVRTQPVEPLWCDLGRCSRTVVVIKLRRTSALCSRMARMAHQKFAKTGLKSNQTPLHFRVYLWAGYRKRYMDGPVMSRNIF